MIGEEGDGTGLVDSIGDGETTLGASDEEGLTVVGQDGRCRRQRAFGVVGTSPARQNCIRKTKITIPHMDIVRDKRPWCHGMLQSMH